MDSPRPSLNSVRLQKYLAHCGVASRRACEELIAAGRVTVDGRVVAEQGVCIDPAVQRVEVDGRPVASEAPVYIVLNKPPNYLCTSCDPQGRATYRELLKGVEARVYSVGRLDRDSEGLLILTNDGELAHRLAHPRHHVEKVYRVWITGELGADAIRRMTGEGILSEGERLRAREVVPMRRTGGLFLYRIVLREGRKRQIRRMVDACGLAVARLQRVGIGPLRLGTLRPGEWRSLGAGEVDALRSAVQREKAVLGFGRPSEECHEND